MAKKNQKNTVVVVVIVSKIHHPTLDFFRTGFLQWWLLFSTTATFIQQFGHVIPVVSRSRRQQCVSVHFWQSRHRLFLFLDKILSLWTPFGRVQIASTLFALASIDKNTVRVGGTLAAEVSFLMTNKTVTKGQVVVIVIVVIGTALGTSTQGMFGGSAVETNASGLLLLLFATLGSVQGTIGHGVSFFSTLITNQMTRMELLTFLVFSVAGKLSILGATIVFGHFGLFDLLLLLLTLVVKIFATEGALLLFCGNPIRRGGSGHG